jgi:hypothetical protein
MPKYKDCWYEDLPEEARKAATVLGWDSKDKWDQSVDVPYRAKTFDQLTMNEKRAAVFLQIDLIGDKLDIFWAQTDEGEFILSVLAAIWAASKTTRVRFDIIISPTSHTAMSQLCTNSHQEGSPGFGLDGT